MKDFKPVRRFYILKAFLWSLCGGGTVTGESERNGIVRVVDPTEKGRLRIGGLDAGGRRGEEETRLDRGHRPWRQSHGDLLMDQSMSWSSPRWAGKC